MPISSPNSPLGFASRATSSFSRALRTTRHNHRVTRRLVTAPQELARLLEPLAAAGIDGTHCSTRRFWEPEFEGSDLNLAGWKKKITGKPTTTLAR